MTRVSLSVEEDEGREQGMEGMCIVGKRVLKTPIPK